MEKKCQVDDNISSTDQVSHGLASSIGENRTILINPRDAEVSTFSSERVHSGQQTSIRSDVSSETGQPFNEKRKLPDAGTAEVIQGDPISKVRYPHKHHKTDSSSSKESGVVRLSSVDSVDPKPCQSTNENSTCGYSRPTLSNESKNLHQDPEPPSTRKSDPVAATVQRSQCEFDLNEGVEANGAECQPKLIHEYDSSIHGSHLLEPIPVLAKVGIPIGSPKKPLQFGGELGWRRSGITSAFRPTFLKNHDTEKGNCGNINDFSLRKSRISRGFDLNVAASMDSELLVDEIPNYGSSSKSERFPLDLNGQNGNKNRHKPGLSGFDLNNNPMTEEAYKNIYRQGETQQLLRNCIAVDTPTCSGGISNQPMSDCRRPPYWVDMSSMRGFGHFQAQTFLLGAPTAEQMQMVVPLQLPHAPPGLYIGKVNSLPPTIYPASVLPPLLNQQGAAVVPQISGPILASYPGNVHLLENSQGLNLHAYANMRQTFLPNGSIALMENGSRGVNTAEIPISARNNLFEERMKPLEQASFFGVSKNRSDPNAGRDSPQLNYRQMAPWN